MATCPKAKVILTVRDSPEAGLKSMRDTVMKGFTPRFFFSTLSLRYLRLHMLLTFTMIEYRLRPQFGTIGGYDSYVGHNAWVQSIVPEETLLGFNVKEGWEPLCKFLDMPVPNVPFPRTKESAMLASGIAKAIRLGFMMWAVYAVLFVGMLLSVRQMLVAIHLPMPWSF